MCYLVSNILQSLTAVIHVFFVTHALTGRQDCWMVPVDIKRWQQAILALLEITSILLYSLSFAAGALVAFMRLYGVNQQFVRYIGMELLSSIGFSGECFSSLRHINDCVLHYCILLVETKLRAASTTGFTAAAQ